MRGRKEKGEVEKGKVRGERDGGRERGRVKASLGHHFSTGGL